MTNWKDPFHDFYFNSAGEVRRLRTTSILDEEWDELTEGQKRDRIEHDEAVRRLEQVGEWPLKPFCKLPRPGKVK